MCSHQSLCPPHVSAYAQPGGGRRDGGAELRDRVGECDVLDRLIEAVQAGQSRTLVVLR